MCLGAALSRAELRIAFGTLLRRLPGLRLDPNKESRRNRMLLIDGFDYLPVVWST